MNKDISSRLKADIQGMYEEDEVARTFFDWAANRINDAAETSVERISQVAGSSYSEARELAKGLCEIGCGQFITGRRGWKSRIQWEFSLRSLGKAASGEPVTIEKVDPVLVEEAKDQGESGSPSESSTKSLSIADAKQGLAETFKVPIEAIEITIKA